MQQVVPDQVLECHSSTVPAGAQVTMTRPGAGSIGETGVAKAGAPTPLQHRLSYLLLAACGPQVIAWHDLPSATVTFPSTWKPMPAADPVKPTARSPGLRQTCLDTSVVLMGPGAWTCPLATSVAHHYDIL